MYIVFFCYFTIGKMVLVSTILRLERPSLLLTMRALCHWRVYLIKISIMIRKICTYLSDEIGISREGYTTHESVCTFL